MKAQLSVKREMSNAKAPVLGQYVKFTSVCHLMIPMADLRHVLVRSFGAAIAGLSAYTSWIIVLLRLNIDFWVFIASIRAYGAETTFKTESLRRIDRYSRAGRSFWNLNRWITIRIDALGSLFAASLAAYLVYFQDNIASTTGFSLNMAGREIRRHVSHMLIVWSSWI